MRYLLAITALLTLACAGKADDEPFECPDSPTLLYIDALSVTQVGSYQDDSVDEGLPDLYVYATLYAEGQHDSAGYTRTTWDILETSTAQEANLPYTWSAETDPEVFPATIERCRYDEDPFLGGPLSFIIRDSDAFGDDLVSTLDWVPGDDLNAATAAFEGDNNARIELSLRWE